MNTLQGSYKVADNTLELSIRNHIESNTKYKKQAIVSGQKWCAVGQMIIGTVSICSGIIAFACTRGLGDYPEKFSTKCKGIENSSFGIWSGVIYIITGILGACRRNNTKQLPFYIGFSITSCVTSASGIIIMFYYFAYCSGCTKTEIELTAKTFFRFTSYAVLIFAHGNGMTFSIIGASFSCCGMECCNQSSTMEEFMSQLQEDTGPGTLSTCPKPPSRVEPPCQYKVEDTNEIEQVYFEADESLNRGPLSYISVEEVPDQKTSTKKPDKPKRYLGIKLLPKI